MAQKNIIQFFGGNRFMTDVALTRAEMDLTLKKLTKYFGQGVSDP